MKLDTITVVGILATVCVCHFGFSETQEIAGSDDAANVGKDLDLYFLDDEDSREPSQQSNLHHVAKRAAPSNGNNAKRKPSQAESLMGSGDGEDSESTDDSKTTISQPTSDDEDGEDIGGSGDIFERKPKNGKKSRVSTPPPVKGDVVTEISSTSTTSSTTEQPSSTSSTPSTTSTDSSLLPMPGRKAGTKKPTTTPTTSLPEDDEDSEGEDGEDLDGGDYDGGSGAGELPTGTGHVVTTGPKDSKTTPSTILSTEEYDTTDSDEDEDDDDKEDTNGDLGAGILSSSTTAPTTTSSTTSSTTTPQSTSTVSSTSTTTTERVTSSIPVVPAVGKGSEGDDDDDNSDDDSTDDDDDINTGSDLDQKKKVSLDVNGNENPAVNGNTNGRQPKNQQPKPSDGEDQGNTLEAEPGNNIAPNGEILLRHKATQRPSTLLGQPGILVAIMGGAVVGLLLAILCVMFVVYRMRKKDEGSYPLGKRTHDDHFSTHRRNYMRPSANKEFYA